VLSVQHHTDPTGVQFAIQPVGDLLSEPLLHLRSGAKCSTSRASLESPRAERYGPSATPIAVVSRSLRLDWDARFFTAPLARPILVTVAQAPPDQVARAAEVADVVIAGDQDVDLATALAALGDRGWQAVLAEGGPTLNGQLARAGLLDELCLTLSPWLASGDAKRILDGRPLSAAGGLRPCSVCEQDGFLFLRYRPRRPEPRG